MKYSADKKLLLTERDAAHLFGMSAAWFQLQRRLGTGPVYLKIGRAVRYAPADLDSFFSSKRIDPTASNPQLSLVEA